MAFSNPLRMKIKKPARTSIELMMDALPVEEATRCFGRLLARYRKRDGRSQLNLALDAGISSRHLGFLEIGRSRPSAEMVVLLAGALELQSFERDDLLLAAGFAPQNMRRNSSRWMPPARSALGARAFEAAVTIAETPSVQVAVRIAQGFFGEIGIHHFMTGTLRRGHEGWEIERDDAGQPAVGWLRHNELRGYRDKDYLVKATAASTSGFFWNDIPSTALTVEQRRIVEEAGDFGIRNGFVMPVHMGNGSVRAFSSWSEKLETNIVTRTAASLVATSLIDSLSRLDAAALPGNAPVRLSSQHNEILSRIAEGASARKIARRLAKPESEIRRMIAMATAAMGCATPDHAASRATALGLIAA